MEEKQLRGHTKTMLLFFGGIVLVMGLSLWGWYRVGINGVRSLSESSFTTKTASVFKTPVAVINGERILYTEYLDNLRAMRTFYDTDTTGLPRPNEADMSEYVLSRLLFNRLTGQIAEEYQVSLEPSEIEKIVNENLLASFPNREKAAEEIMSRHGWTLEEFVEKIVKPTELEQKLSKVYLDSIQDPAKKEMQKKQGESVLAKVKNGESFEALATQLNTDGTGEFGGDLGWFARGTIAPQFEEIVFVLEKGAVANNLVETELGYHILKVDDSRTVKDESTGQEVQEVKISHILFQTRETDTTPFTVFMNQRLAAAEIEVSKGLQNPFENVENNIQ
ncbi:MAG: peptidylprolyl isomerase [Candidatus Magasanikbacteria bacterium]|nr:peptidylprolyl isomerase [Candidatus Magasanikbacteria bacterium]